MTHFVDIYRITFVFLGKLVYASFILLSVIVIFERYDKQK
jgi:hypothetical protein